MGSGHAGQVTAVSSVVEMGFNCSAFQKEPEQRSVAGTRRFAGRVTHVGGRRPETQRL